MTPRNRRVAVIGGVVVVVLLAAGVAALLLTGGDGPDPLTFDDAPTTVADGSATSTTGGGGSAAGEPGSVDGDWRITSGSQAGYRVLEDRIGGLANINAVGRTDEVTGGFHVDGTTVTDVEVVVDVASIRSDSSLRDGRFRDSIMDVSEFPTATFRASELQLAEVPADGATVSVPVTGELTLRGVTREVTTTLEVRRTGDQVQVLGSIPVTFADFGIETPSPPGLSVRDEGTVEFLVVAERSGTDRR